MLPNDVVSTAFPVALTMAVPRELVPLENVTMPLGLEPVMLAVKVTCIPVPAMLLELVNAVVVGDGAGSTVSSRTIPVFEAGVASES